MQRGVIETAQRRGLRVVAIDPDPNAVGLALADEAHVADLSNIDLCTRVAERARVSGVLTFGADYPVPSVAAVAFHLGLPGISLDAATRATDKAAMRAALDKHSVAVPEWRLVSTVDEALDAARELGGALVVKPRRSSGSRGVSLIGPSDTDEVVKTAAARALADSWTAGAVVERYVAGPEFSIEAVTSGGDTRIVAVTAKEVSAPPHCVELAHVQPATMSELERRVIDEVVASTIAAIGVDHAVSHTEVRLTRDGPVVMEIAARAAGGFIASHLVPLSTGVDLTAVAVALALGENPDLSSLRQAGAAVRFLCPAPGRVVDIRGIDGARRLPGVCVVDVNLSVGQVVAPLRDSRDRVGYVIASGDDASQAARRATRAACVIEVVVA